MTSFLIGGPLGRAITLRTLTANQYLALRNWIYAGGTLVISGGYDTAILRTPRIAQLLPVQVVGTRQLQTGRALHRALGVSALELHQLAFALPPGAKGQLKASFSRIQQTLLRAAEFSARKMTLAQRPSIVAKNARRASRSR